MMYDIEQIGNQIKSTFPSLRWRLSINPQQTLVLGATQSSIFQVNIVVAEFGVICDCVVGASSQSKGVSISRVDYEDIETGLKLFKDDICSKVLEISTTFNC